MALWRGASYSAPCSPDLRPSMRRRTGGSICGRGPTRTRKSCRRWQTRARTGYPLLPASIRPCGYRSPVPLSPGGGWATGRARGRKAADDARRGRAPGAERQEVPDLRVFLERHPFCNGPRFSGLPMQLRDASRHERACPYLSRGVRAPGRTALPPAPHPRHERGRRLRERTVYTPLPRLFR